ncbi:MAG: acyl-CoA dehydrogenase [Candidatus Azotimanducaceae bacterium]|jgi:acyl-CoA dehydrogenase
MQQAKNSTTYLSELMQTQKLLDLIIQASDQDAISHPEEFIALLRSDAINTFTDPFERLVHAARRAGSQTNATIAGHQAAIRRLFPTTPANAITAFCVSESKGPHPRYIETQLLDRGGDKHITGEKMWGTMAPAADLLYVAASTGVEDGQNQLVMVGIETNSPTITQIPLPPERPAGGVPICDLKFELTPVHNNLVFDGDAYTVYIKPFRLVEDVFSTTAMQIGLLQLGAQTGMSHAQREDLVGLVVQAAAIAASEMNDPGDILLITSYLRASRTHWQTLGENWNNAAADVRPHWNTEREILNVAARAREQRRNNAWQALGETPLDEQDTD